MQNIYLIGFMGCGKTTFGEYLAKHWKMQFIDLDEVIVKEEGMSISQCFEMKGEAYFRKRESSILLEQKDIRNTVIATGGGIIENDTNREFLCEQEVIYLKWPFDVLYDRIRGDKNRPLATSYEALKKRFDQRSSRYETCATLVVDCQGHTLETALQYLSSYYNTK